MSEKRPNPNKYNPNAGRIIREDLSEVNIANILAPVPNGDQIITVSAPGVKTLTPPNDGSIMARITVPVDCYVRFGAVPAVNAGELIYEGECIEFESPEEIEQAQIYVTAACTLFVQYYK